jgi:hypothetical protein
LLRHQATGFSLMVIVAKYRQTKTPTGFVLRSALRHLHEGQASTSSYLKPDA